MKSSIAFAFLFAASSALAQDKLEIIHHPNYD